MQANYSAALSLPSRGRWRRRAAGVLCLTGLAWAGAVCAAEGYTVPAGETYELSNMTMDLECGDLVVNGTLNVSNTTFQNVNHIVVSSGGVLAATGSTFDVARSNLQINGRFTGRSINATYSCNGGGTNPPVQMAPIPTNGPLGLALMSLLLGAALPARRWLNKRRQAAR